MRTLETDGEGSKTTSTTDWGHQASESRHCTSNMQKKTAPTSQDWVSRYMESAENTARHTVSATKVLVAPVVLQ